MRSLLQLKQTLLAFERPIVLGGGSNVLFTQDSEQPVLIVDIKGIQITGEDKSSVSVNIGAGEIWHDVVIWALENQLGGIENLSLIPGKCGAAPIQNIGAYGVELSDCLIGVHCVERESGKEFYFTNDECLFNYRDSIFKNAWKDKFVIANIDLRLTKKGHHIIYSSYGDIRKRLRSLGIEKPSISDVSNAVIEIRKSKLPDPLYLPNAGSFFKNPIISISTFTMLKKEFPNLPNYPHTESHAKIPAGWLIDQCNWKGIMVDKVGVHNKQALVLVNHGTKNGSKILKLSQLIQESVYRKFGIQLECEVNII